MADIRVTEPHTFTAATAKAKVAGFEEMMAKYRVSTEWRGNKAEIKGMGVGGSIDVTDRDVTVVVKLGLMAKAAGIDATKLEGSIRKRLRAAFDAVPPA
jgi:putative polyhydroxyalkanoate system protein